MILTDHFLTDHSPIDNLTLSPKLDKYGQYVRQSCNPCPRLASMACADLKLMYGSQSAKGTLIYQGQHFVDCPMKSPNECRHQVCSPVCFALSGPEV